MCRPRIENMGYRGLSCLSSSERSYREYKINYNASNPIQTPKQYVPVMRKLGTIVCVPCMNVCYISSSILASPVWQAPATYWLTGHELQTI